jgi:hypothetical protein
MSTRSKCKSRLTDRSGCGRFCIKRIKSILALLLVAGSYSRASIVAARSENDRAKQKTLHVPSPAISFTQSVGAIRQKAIFPDVRRKLSLNEK